MTYAKSALREIDTKVTPRTTRHYAIVVTRFVWIVFAAAIPIQRWLPPELIDLIDKGVLGLLLISLLFGLVSKPKLSWVWLVALVVVPLAAFLSGRTSSVAASMNVGLQLAILCAIAPFALAFHVRQDSQFVRRVASAFLTVQTFSALLGIVQLAGIETLGARAIFGRSTGLAGHPNVLGFMAAIALTACLGILISKNARLRPAVLISLLINGVVLVGTGSLSAMLAAVVALTIVMIVSRTAVMVLVASVLALTALTGFLVLAGFDAGILLSFVEYRVGVVTGTGASDGGAASLDTRGLTYAWAWNYLATNPLIGVGLDPMFAGTYDGITVVHNFLLRAWYQGGLLFAAWMLVAALALVIGIVLPAIAKGRNALPAAIIAGTLTFAWTSAFYTQVQYWLPLLLAVGMIPIARGRRSIRHRDAHDLVS